MAQTLINFKKNYQAGTHNYTVATKRGGEWSSKK